MRSSYDAVVIGGGHNGLVAAAYLSRAGLTTLVLERRPVLGGATLSAEIFPGVQARPSVYSYLVSLLPKKIISDLGLNFEAKRRRMASFIPYFRQGKHRGLLISNADQSVARQSFFKLTGGAKEYENYLKLIGLEEAFAGKIWPTMLQPLQDKKDLRRLCEKDSTAMAAWDMFVENPLGRGLENLLKDDVVRGYVFTEAKIGMLTDPYDETLLQNRTYLYHIIGNTTGEWRVPVGGMGALVSELERVARGSGAEFRLSAEAVSITPGKEPAVTFTEADGAEKTVQARWVLCNTAPAVLADLLPGYQAPEVHQGAVFKINMLLKKLPRLKAGSVSPEDAFGGTFHVDEGYEDMRTSFDSARSNVMPECPPGEMYCHTLTDDSILSDELRRKGYHTLTFFGLDTPYSLFKDDNEAVKARALELYLQGINSKLEDTIEDCLALDAEGKPCMEVKSPVDIEKELNMPLGNIFHGDLSWPFAESEEGVGQWGVETGFDNILICGSGARRGGAVSGIPGHNAAQKVLGSIRA